MRVDKPMNILNKKHKIVIGALSIITVFLVYVGIQKINEMTRTPFLKITTRSRVSWLSSGKDYYYILYDNGNLEETEMFYQSDVESYDLYMYENNIPKESAMGNWALDAEIKQAIANGWKAKPSTINSYADSIMDRLNNLIGQTRV